MDLRHGRHAPFRPPNVSGWDEERWLDTSTFRGRWYAVAEILDHDLAGEDDYPPRPRSRQSIRRSSSGATRRVSQTTLDALLEFGTAVEAETEADWQKGTFRALRQNALRALIATSPELQAC